MNLFEQENNNNKDKPLAYRMRPQTLDELEGQNEIVGKGQVLRRAIKADIIQSLILYGPPGSGKTSLAQVIANKTDAEFIKLNAVTSGVKDLREVISKAKNNQNMYNKKTILFIDEIHRFNKSQQDALLPAVEDGTVIMIGATTENPYFEVNSPLLSRSQIYKLNPLNEKDILNILNRAIEDKKRGLGEYNIDFNKEILEFITKLANGDARTALNILEMAVLTTPPNSNGKIILNKEVIADSAQEKKLNYDKGGDNHYDNISAMIKSMRGSDPDAAVFYLSKMLEAGEDPKFIARRIIVHAAEDVGLADPQALVVANSAARAVEFVGLPEARIPLAEAVIYIATAPKSNSVIKAIDKASRFVKNNDSLSVPSHLRDSHYSGAEELNNGKGYLYPHNYPNNYVAQQYLPDEAKDKKFYEPNGGGNEKSIKKWLKKLKDLENKGK
ncbi:MAG: replication-associated recombination protein A [Bacillota bacterium]